MMKEGLVEVLETAGAEYVPLHHERTETAAAEALALGVPATDVAKTVVVDTPGGHVRVVLPACERLDLHKLRDLLGRPGKGVHLASEDELVRDYPEFELGAVPPFGGARHESVVIDVRVVARERVVVGAGSHEDSVRLGTADLVRVTQGRVADVCLD